MITPDGKISAGPRPTNGSNPIPASAPASTPAAPKIVTSRPAPVPLVRPSLAPQHKAETVRTLPQPGVTPATESSRESAGPRLTVNPVIDANSMRPKEPVTIPKEEVEIGELGDAPETETKAEAEEVAPFTLPKETDEAATQPGDSVPTETPVEEVKDNPQAKGRNYTGFTPDQADILKKLGNVQFAKASKVFNDFNKKIHELETKPPPMLHEHPNSYVLNPDFQAAESTAQQATSEYQHYHNQLIQIKSGKPWHKLSYDEKTGAPIYTKIEPREDGTLDVAAEVDVTQALNYLSGIREDASRKVKTIATEHKNQRKQVEQVLKTIDEKFFPSIKYETLAPIEKKVYDSSLSLIPQFTNHPLAPLLGKSAVVVQKQNTIIAKLEARLAKYEKIKTIQKAAGETPKARGGGSGAVGNDTVVSLED